MYLMCKVSESDTCSYSYESRTFVKNVSFTSLKKNIPVNQQTKHAIWQVCMFLDLRTNTCRGRRWTMDMKTIVLQEQSDHWSFSSHNCTEAHQKGTLHRRPQTRNRREVRSRSSSKCPLMRFLSIWRCLAKTRRDLGSCGWDWVSRNARCLWITRTSKLKGSENGLTSDIIRLSDRVFIWHICKYHGRKCRSIFRHTPSRVSPEPFLGSITINVVFCLLGFAVLQPWNPP